MSRISRRGFLGGALGGIASTRLSEARAQATDAEAPENAGEEEAAPAAAPEPPAGEDALALSFFRNGEEVRAHTTAHESALDVLRRTGSRGVKPGCGSGSCGACTVLVEGTPHVTCLLPAVALDGLAITTPEGVATGPGVSQLHPVQRAFLAEDALQCGYCTPGFVVEAAAFHDRWRATRGTSEPDRGSIARALSGHLCRCGAYPAIYRAVAAACRGDHDGQRVNFARTEAPAKVRGEAPYTVDVALPELLEARVLRSPVAHGIVRKLDLAAVKALPGVAAVHVVTDVGRRVRYVGQEIVAVAADSRELAEQALTLIDLELQELPAVITEAQARSEGAPQVWAERADRREAPEAGEIPARGARWEGNVRGPASSSILARPGRARRAVESGEGPGVSSRWATQVQCHTALEPHAAVARWTAGALEVWASTQSCAALAEDLAQLFKLKSSDVTVRAAHVGGAFGAKVGLQMESRLAAELARIADRPVRLVLDRHEELMVGGNRPAQIMELGLRLDEDGELAGVSYTSANLAGVAVGHNSGFIARLTYPERPKELDDFDVLTHTPPGQPFRGPGGPGLFLALEGALDELAGRLGEDPVALRRRIDEDPIRQGLYDWAEGLDVWAERGPVGQGDGRFRRGVGLSAASWFHLWDPGTQVELEASGEGVIVRCATQDPGTGTRSVLAEIVGSRLGLDRGDIQVRIGDSRFKRGPASSGSRVTSSVTPAAEHAVEQLIEVLVDRAADQGLEGEPDIGGLRTLDGKLVPWRTLLTGQPPVWTLGRRRRDEKAALLPFPVQGLKIGRVLPSAVTVAEVMVDLDLGRVWVQEVWVGVAAGRIVTPVLARSQVEGAVIQGISYALYEERRLDPRTGQLISHDFDHYALAGMADAPPVHVRFDESGGFEHVRGGAVGLAELGTVGVPAALANAVFHATGRRPRRLPLDLEQTLRDLA